jgi:hypothetical protein
MHGAKLKKLHILLHLNANIFEEKKCAKLGNLPRKIALSEFWGEN